MTRRNCGRCHACGTMLRAVQDGEEWCPYCKRFRRYSSHGWGKGADPDSQECPTDYQLLRAFLLAPGPEQMERGDYRD